LPTHRRLIDSLDAYLAVQKDGCGLQSQSEARLSCGSFAQARFEVGGLHGWRAWRRGEEWEHSGVYRPSDAPRTFVYSVTELFHALTGIPSAYEIAKKQGIAVTVSMGAPQCVPSSPPHRRVGGGSPGQALQSEPVNVLLECNKFGGLSQCTRLVRPPPNRVLVPVSRPDLRPR
jgi:hypothetical protein